jgi:proteasome accessory factor A
LVSIDTMNKRPLINTRDEPHADASKYRRFHVIMGDSNMSEWATALKIGLTSIVLDLIERDKAPQIEIAQPIDATKSISRDQNYDWILEMTDGRKISAIDLQRLYLSAAQKEFQEGEETIWLLREWEMVLNDLERDVALARDRVDWVAKKFLLEAFREEEHLDWTDPWLQAIDLEYHNILPGCGLFHELLQQKSIRTLVTEEEIRHAIFAPPETTRAYFRGRSVARFNDEILSIQWGEITFGYNGRVHLVTLPEAAGDARLERLNALVRRETQFPEFFETLQAHS